MSDVKYPQVEVKDFGIDGNAAALIGQCRASAERAGLSKEQMDEFRDEATSGDYDHLIQTCMRYFNCEYFSKSSDEEDHEEDPSEKIDLRFGSDNEGKIKIGLDTRLDTAFEELDLLGYFARQDHWCCSSCSTYEVPQKFRDKFVLFHRQDLEGFLGGRSDGRKGFYLIHGEGCGDRKELMKILKKHKLNPEWKGDTSERIWVNL